MAGAPTRLIPGAVIAVEREVCYLSEKQGTDFAKLFRRLVRFVNPPLAKGGGVIVEGCRLTLPTGERFQAVSYRGDIEGWRRQITEGARALHVVRGQIVGSSMALSDGRTVRLEDCQLDFY